MEENKTIINLQPIINDTKPNFNTGFNSFFMYIFAIFEFIIIILIMYYFYDIEMLFLYNIFFKKNTYSTEDKKFYNNFMKQFKYLIETKKKCLKVNNVYYPVYDNNVKMVTLDNKVISFDDQNKCTKFLGL